MPKPFYTNGEKSLNREQIAFVLDLSTLVYHDNLEMLAVIEDLQDLLYFPECSSELFHDELVFHHLTIPTSPNSPDYLVLVKSDRS